MLYKKPNVASKEQTIFFIYHFLFSIYSSCFFFSDPCKDNGCEHICTNSDDGAVCHCKEGYTLNKDKKTCTGNCICMVCHEKISFNVST